MNIQEPAYFKCRKRITADGRMKRANRFGRWRRGGSNYFALENGVGIGVKCYLTFTEMTNSKEKWFCHEYSTRVNFGFACILFRTVITLFAKSLKEVQLCGHRMRPF